MKKIILKNVRNVLNDFPFRNFENFEKFEKVPYTHKGDLSLYSRVSALKVRIFCLHERFALSNISTAVLRVLTTKKAKKG